jgi:hypothetical protein
LKKSSGEVCIDHIHVDMLIVLFRAIPGDVVTPEWQHNNIKFLMIGQDSEFVGHLR